MVARMGFRYRLIDDAGSELGLVELPAEQVEVGDSIQLPHGRDVQVLDVYDDEYGREGDVQATLVIPEE
jgi:hypothetical protein